MKKIYFLFFLTIVPVMSSAQGKIEYSYDDAGNRIKRSKVLKFNPNLFANDKGFFYATDPLVLDKHGEPCVMVTQNALDGNVLISMDGIISIYSSPSFGYSRVVTYTIK